MSPHDPRLTLAALAFLTGFLPALGRLVQRRVQPALRGRRIRRRLGAPVSREALRALPRDAVIAVEGTLRFAGDGGVSSYHPHAVAGMEEASVYAWTPDPPDAWLEVGAERIALEPPLQVVSGTIEWGASVEVVRWRGPSAPTQDGRVKCERRSLFSGQRVRARGRLDFEARDAEGAQEGGYRDAARGYRLRPERDPAWPGRPIPLAAAGAPPTLGFMSPLYVLAIGAFSGLVLTLVALLAQRRLEYTAFEPSPRPACAQLTEMMLDHGDPEGALSLRCDDPLSTARAHWLRGDTARASDAWLAAREANLDVEPTVSEAQAHALAGRPREAERVVARMSARWYHGPGSQEREGLDCIGAGFGRRGGAPAATHDLEASMWRGGPECQAVLGDFGYRVAPEPLGALYDAEQVGGSGGGVFHDPYGLIQHGSAWIHLRPLALEASILRQIDPPPGETPRPIAWKSDKLGYGHHAAEIAAFLALMGERDEAAHHLDLLDRIDATTPPYPTNAPRDFDPDEAFDWSKIMSVAAGTAALLDDRERLPRYLARADAHSRAVIEHHLALLRDAEADPSFGGLWWPHADLFPIASRGDGAALADALAGQRTLAGPVLAELLPRIRSRPEALREWAQGRIPPPCASCGLFTLAEHVADRREIARLVGDRALEARMGKVAHRLAEIILRRDGAPEIFALEALHERITQGRR